MAKDTSLTSRQLGAIIGGRGKKKKSAIKALGKAAKKGLGLAIGSDDINVALINLAKKKKKKKA